MKFSQNRIVAAFFAVFLVSLIGGENVGASETQWWSKFMEKPKEASSDGSGSEAMNEEKALYAAMKSISDSVESTLKTIAEEARSVKGSFGVAEEKVKTSLRSAANIIESEIKDVKKEIKPMLNEMKSYWHNTQKDLGLLLPAKEIVRGMAHMIRLIKEKQQITLSDSHVKRFVARLINLMLVLSSFFSFYVIATSGPLLWGIMLAPLAMFNFVTMSTSSMVQESYLQDVEAKEADLIVKRTTETGMPVSKSNGQEIAGFLNSISDAELEQMAEESDVYNRTGVKVTEFPKLFRRTVTNWFVQDPK